MEALPRSEQITRLRIAKIYWLQVISDWNIHLTLICQDLMRTIGDKQDLAITDSLINRI